jgi:hypothetical protein
VNTGQLKNTSSTIRMKKSLYNPKDVARVRDELFDKQDQKCAITGLAIDKREAVLDHCHSSNHVRAVLHRQSNATLGKIENMWNRYLAWWYPHDLATFLRQCADYLERQHPQEYYHPGWKKDVLASFNKLQALPQMEVLQDLYDAVGLDIPVDKKNNSTIRKAQFKKLILNRSLGYDIIVSTIQNVKDKFYGT